MHELQVFEARLLPIHGGSIEVHAGHPGARRVNDSVPRLHATEAEKGLGEIATYRRFAADVVALRARLLEMLHAYHAAGRTVWAYGAPAKGATLLNSFGIGRALVQKAVERNKLKIGLAIPGVRLPIEAEGTGHPDVYLVLAWNFIAEFLEKERAFLAAGGEMLVPIPAVQVFRAQNA
jgi:hypothetical protein